MPTIRDRILEYLQVHPEGATDAELADVLGVTRPQANSRCRELAEDGQIERRKVEGRFRNLALGSPAVDAADEVPGPQTERPWFWEGNVQARVVSYLQGQGYTIRQTADTASHEHGIDVVAARAGRELWVSVKGYPKGTARTKPGLQAGHWFKGVFFDMIVYRGKDANVDLAVALPDYPRYRDLVARVRWIEPTLRFSWLWVSEDGAVALEGRDFGG